MNTNMTKRLCLITLILALPAVLLCDQYPGPTLARVPGLEHTNPISSRHYTANGVVTTYFPEEILAFLCHTYELIDLPGDGLLVVATAHPAIAALDINKIRFSLCGCSGYHAPYILIMRCDVPRPTPDGCSFSESANMHPAELDIGNKSFVILDVNGSRTQFPVKPPVPWRPFNVN